MLCRAMFCGFSALLTTVSGKETWASELAIDRFWCVAYAIYLQCFRWCYFWHSNRTQCLLLETNCCLPLPLYVSQQFDWKFRLCFGFVSDFVPLFNGPPLISSDRHEYRETLVAHFWFTAIAGCRFQVWQYCATQNHSKNYLFLS